MNNVVDNSLTPERLKLPNFKFFPWDTVMTEKGSLSLDSDFAALSAVESCKFPTSMEGQELKAAMGLTHLIENHAGNRTKEKGSAYACSFITAYRLIDVCRRLKGSGGSAVRKKGHFDISDKKMPPVFLKLDSNLSTILQTFRKNWKTNANHSHNAGEKTNLLDYITKLNGSLAHFTVLVNFSLATVHLRAMLIGSANKYHIPDLPDTKPTLLEIFNQLYPHADLTSNFWQGTTPQQIRTALQVASLVTPVALLAGNRFDNSTFKRDMLMECFMHAGNTRPHEIRRLEDKIWNSLFSLARNPNSASCDIINALHAILDSSEFQDAEDFALRNKYSFFRSQHQGDVEDVGAQGVEMSTSFSLMSVDTGVPTTANERPRPVEALNSTIAPSSEISPNYDENSMSHMGYDPEDSWDIDKMMNLNLDTELALVELENQALARGPSPIFRSGGDQHWDEGNATGMEEYGQKDIGDGEAMDEDGTGHTEFQRGKKDQSDDSDESTTNKQELGQARSEGENEEIADGDEDMANADDPDQVGSQRREEENRENNDDDDRMANEDDSGQVTSQRREKENEESNDSDEDENMENEGYPGQATSQRGENEKEESDGDDESEEGEGGPVRAAAQRTQFNREESLPTDKPRQLTGTPARKSAQQPTSSVNRLSKPAQASFGHVNSAQRPTALKKRSSKAGPKSKAAIEDERGASTGTSTESIYEKVAEDIWVERRSCNLDTNERPKIPCDREATVYNPCGERISFRPNVHREDVLTSLQALIEEAERNYVDGKPLHCHPTKKDLSVFHTVAHVDFEALSDKEVQEILRHQHIVVYGEPHKKLSLTQAARVLGGNLDRMIDIQDQSLPASTNHNNILRVGTLDDMIAHANSPTGNSLNALSFPMGQASMEPMPFASDTYALLRMTQTPGWGENQQFPTASFRWAGIGSDVLSHFHLDCNGLATYVSPITGLKVWFSVRSLGLEKPDFSLFEDIGYMFDRGFHIDGSGFKISNKTAKEQKPQFTLEAVCLEPGTRLIMRPNTLHAVYTPGSSVFRGGHFFSTSTMKDTLAGTFHTFVHDALITNAELSAAYSSLRRIISMYHRALVEDGIDHEDESSLSHIPDLRTFDGFIDLLIACNLGRLLNVIDFRTYGGSVRMNQSQALLWKNHDLTPLPTEERTLNRYARGQCAELLAWADLNYILYSQSEQNYEEMSIDRFQKQLLERHVQLLELYKLAADDNKAVHRPNFTSEHLGLQLDAICEKYGVQRLGNKSLGTVKNLATMKAVDRRLFPVQKWEIKEKGGPSNRSTSSGSSLSKVAELILQGSTKRDVMNMAHRNAVKQEAPGTPVQNSKKRKMGP